MKFNTFLKIGFIILVACQFSCRKDFSTVKSNGNLSFSNDTLFLDTVFNNLSTTTNILKVYNNSKEDILIPKIKLEKSDSKYRINIDGVSGTEFENVLLLKKDSLYIFVEATVAANETNAKMLYDDKILFDPNGTKQSVDLVTLIKKAHLLYSKTTNKNSFELTQNKFSKEIPYVIYGNAIVSENSNLTIEAGSVVYFHENSSLTISKGATLNINGTLHDSIVFKGDNLNYDYDQVPGQWQGININNANTVNINYLKILNPTTGLKITDNTNPINIKNTEIYNASENGIYTTNTNITGENIVVGQTRKSGLYLQGGDYTFKHCTFANYWIKRIESNVSLANYYLDKDSKKITAPLNSANFINCIISGSKNDELFLDKNKNESIFNFNIKNCLLDLNKGEDLYDTSNTNYYKDVLYNKKLDFRNTNINDLRIGLDNEGINQADKPTANQVPLDIIGTDRTTAPDIGAYQHIDFKNLDVKIDE